MLSAQPHMSEKWPSELGKMPNILSKGGNIHGVVVNASNVSCKL